MRTACEVAISSVDLRRGVVILMSGEEIPITNHCVSTRTQKVTVVVAGPMLGGGWAAVEVDEDEQEDALKEDGFRCALSEDEKEDLRDAKNLKW